MAGRDDWKSGGRRIDDRAIGAFLAAVHRGALLEDAARCAGFTLGAFYRHRKRDPAFEEALQDAMEYSSAPVFIRPSNGRRHQLRRHRRLRFVEWRREVFLARFAGTCNETEAAAAAGVSTATVYRHRVKDPGFAARHREALDQGYVRLEAEALRQRLEAQQRLRESPELAPTGELAQEFDRVLKLLARWERRDGRIAPRTVGHGRRETWTFDEAIDLLEHRLKSLGVQVPPPPDSAEGPDEGGEGEGP